MYYMYRGFTVYTVNTGIPFIKAELNSIPE